MVHARPQGGLIVENGPFYAHLTETLQLTQAMGQRIVALVRAGVLSPDDPLYVQWDLLVHSTSGIVKSLKDAQRADV